MARTTSFGGTSPEVFREKVVRSDTECISGCTVRSGRARGGREGKRKWEWEMSGSVHPRKLCGRLGVGYFTDYYLYF
jgi:hypothetical protein